MNLINNKRYKLSQFIVASFLLFASYLLNIQRNWPDYRYLGKIFFWLFFPVFVVGFIGLFIREEILSLLRRFTIYFLVISIFLISIIPNSTHGMDILGFTKEHVTIVIASLYSIFSLGIILYKSFKKS